MATRPTFPLPRGYFAATSGAAQLSDDERAHCQSLVRTQLDAVLRAEHAFAHTQERRVDTRKWRLARKEHKLRIYRRRTNILHDTDRGVIPSLLAVGRVDGSIESVLAGLHAKSHDELQATMAYLDANTRDSALLQTLERAQPDDPLHSRALKWTLARMPSSPFAKSRDWCFLEAFGTARDCTGARYGYIILHSVDTRTCPAFDETVAVRARGSFAFVLRDGAPGTTEVYAHGLLDAMGDLPPHTSVATSSDIFARLDKAAQCAEAKKLTLLAVRNYTANAACEAASELQSTCYLCIKSPGMFASLKLCNVCGATACAKCRVKRLVFAGVDHTLCDIISCKTCVLVAKDAALHVADESFILRGGSEDASDDRTAQRETIWRGTELGATLPTGPTEDGNGEDDSTVPVARRRSSNCPSDSVHDDDAEPADDDDVLGSLSMVSEEDVERLIEDLVIEKQRRKNQWRAQSAEPSAVSRTATSAASASGTSSTRSFNQSVRWETQPMPPPPPMPMPMPMPRMCCPPPTPEALGHTQVELFHRMVALQTAAHHVYAITQANKELMLRKL